MKQLIYIIMLPCKEATELMEKKSVMGLSKKDGMALSLHLIGCRICRAYTRQLGIITKTLEKISNSSLKKNLVLSDKIKSKILNDMN